MTSVLRNFVTIRKNRGDILTPAESRSAVEMIRGIVKNYSDLGFNDTYVEFLRHLSDINDPHETTKTDFYDEVLMHIHDVYKNMTSTPLSLEDFKTDIVPTVSFLELIRRIVLNRYLYNKVKNPDGSVPSIVRVKLNADWGRHINVDEDVEVVIDNFIRNEVDFIRRGWTTTTQPYAIIFNAIDIGHVPEYKNTIFYTSMEAPYFSKDFTQSGYPVSLYLNNNDFSCSVAVGGTPVVKSEVVRFIGFANVLSVSIDTNYTVEVLFNNQVVFTQIPCGEGIFDLNMDKFGVLTIKSLNLGTVSSVTSELLMIDQTPFTTAMVLLPLKSFFGQTFGIKELSIVK